MRELRTATIEAGQSRSSILDIADRRMAGIYAPANWTEAPFFVEVSEDQQTWFTFHDLDSSWYVAVEFGGPTVAGRFFSVNPVVTAGVRFLRFASGTPDAPVPQVQQVDLTVVLVPE